VASKRSKARTAKAKAPKAKPGAAQPQFDLEALGLVLLALGIFILGMLIAALPTGQLGRTLRGLLLGHIGYGAYALPWPPLLLGGLFLLRKNPKGWPRVLLGYALFCAGLWSLLMLSVPTLSGSWGVALRGYLAGATGVLAYAPALLLLSLGLELLFALPPTYLARNFLRTCARGVGWAWQGFVRLRREAKSRAALYADAVLAKNELRALAQDLSTLQELYPGSAELASWRMAVEASLHRLNGADEGALADVEADLRAWRQAVGSFTAGRALELQARLEAEGFEDFEPWVKEMEPRLETPVAELPALGLDAVRRTLALDLTALSERYRRLTRERDLQTATLKAANLKSADPEISPQALHQALQAYQARTEHYEALRGACAKLLADAERLEPWRELAAELAHLNETFPDDERVLEYRRALTQGLSERGRGLLEQHPRWQEKLHMLAQQLSQPASEAPDVTAETEEQVTPIQDALAEADSETPPWEDASPVDVPQVGGILLTLPSCDLLDERPRGAEAPLAQAREVRERIAKIDETLANFKLQGRVVASVRGPTVTRFEVEPAPGEKISRFAGLSDDLALAMAVGSVRIEAPIPGKSVIGLEVPNAHRDLISFREAAEAPGFKRSKARLPLVLGKSIDGEMVLADLAKMPHLLIAGSTGSGKSVAVNTLIGSLLYKFLPTELRFLMVDPKMVELTPFDGIPHLLRPVVTNPGDAAGVLLGAVGHMERRYKMMSKVGAKNLDQYNQKARNLDLPELPFIIIVIDELADLMITSPKEVESAIMRLAQMARATGMHLLLATQRPSVDILTSLIKVNIPARMAFAVSSGHDSRTILDSMGAERLTGLGDMLFYQPGLVKSVRLQGPFVSEPEIHALADFLRRQYFDDDFVEAYGADFDPLPADDSSASGLIDWNDDKLREAAELVINEGQASVSRLQRRLSVGHARAGKLMDSLEALGVVGTHTGSKPREVLVELEELPDIFGK
jgi:S-DNA-T family DNA segregation ATPase FtsK/SpoIIIE